MSDDILALLLVLALAAAVVAAARRSARRRYQAPAQVAFGVFTAYTDVARAVLLDCEGHCRGVTAHEPHGDGQATCITCGTPRVLIDEHDEA